MMKVERYDKQTNKVDIVTLENCIKDIEGYGYCKPGTSENILENGNDIFTSTYIYNKAKD